MGQLVLHRVAANGSVLLENRACAGTMDGPAEGAGAGVGPGCLAGGGKVRIPLDSFGRAMLVRFGSMGPGIQIITRGWRKVQAQSQHPYERK